MQISIVMVSCSCFAPTPSMAAMLVNKFNMNPNVLTYSLAGMGCSSSVVCVDMARHLLKALPDTVALIVNHENITENFYSGNDTSMQLTNSLFRAGGAAAIVSNRQASSHCHRGHVAVQGVASAAHMQPIECSPPFVLQQCNKLYTNIELGRVSRAGS